MIKSIAILALLTGCAGSYMNSASVYAGVDKTAMNSPMCMDNGTGDTKLTSNMGLKSNLWKYNRWSVDAKWTHHSCVFADDAPQYDGIGFGIDYKFWVKGK